MDNQVVYDENMAEELKRIHEHLIPLKFELSKVEEGIAVGIYRKDVLYNSQARVFNALKDVEMMLFNMNVNIDALPIPQFGPGIVNVEDTSITSKTMQLN